MWLNPLFERFVDNSPVTVIVRTLMESVLDEDRLDALFEQTAQTGYTREILFSTLVNMMVQVVCSVHQSIGAVFKLDFIQLRGVDERIHQAFEYGARDI
jgi:CII-binding regulator of phage lambda lysogenization HflD